MLAVVVAGIALLGGTPHQTFVLQTDLPVWDIAIADLDGNGRRDVLALCSDPASYPLKKSLVVFTLDANGEYPTRPSAQLALDTSVGTAFVAETDGKPPNEIIVADQSSATVFQLVGTQFRRLSETRLNSLLPTGSTEPLFQRDVATDLDGDGIDEWLIPVPGSYEIRNAQGFITRVSADIESETVEYGATVIQHRLPAAYPFDLPGQTRKGLAFLSDRFADFSYGTNWSEHYRYRINSRLDESWEAYARMDDINGDGFPDIVVTQTQGTIDLEAQTQVYVALEPFKYPQTPTAQFATKGSFTTPVLLDVNGDEQLDLILLGIPLGLRNIITYFFRRKVSVQIDAHLFENGRFTTKPAFRTHITMEAPEGRQRVVYAMGDFTGDGHIDAAVGVSHSKLAIFTGDPKTFLSSRPWKTFQIPAFGSARPEDLDGDGTEDLVIFHPGAEHSQRIDIILF